MLVTERERERERERDNWIFVGYAMSSVFKCGGVG